MSNSNDMVRLFGLIPVKKLEKPNFFATMVYVIIWMQLLDIFVAVTPLEMTPTDDFLFSITVGFIAAVVFNVKFVKRKPKKEEDSDEQ